MKNMFETHSFLAKAEDNGYPAFDFEEWYQQGMACYQAAFSKPLRKQAMRALAARWKMLDKHIELWHIRAFVYGSKGLDSMGQRGRIVRDDYVWPEPPDAAWALIACCYPDGYIDLDFVHPVSRRFWSEDNDFLPLPEERLMRFDRLWYERMGFEIMTMMPIARVSTDHHKSHLRVVQQNS